MNFDTVKLTAVNGMYELAAPINLREVKFGGRTEVIYAADVL